MKRHPLRIFCLSLLTVTLLYLLFWPVNIDPASWLPSEAPLMEGVYKPNDDLKAISRFPVEGVSYGPEDVAEDAQGRIYGGMSDGRIIRMVQDGSSYEVFAQTNGKPSGLDFAPNGDLIVADPEKGLLAVSQEGQVLTLARSAQGLEFGITDDVDVAKDGTIFFSDATWKFKVETYRLDIAEHRPNGRLLAYDRQTGKTQVLLDDLYFANGVAVTHDQNSVLVVETGAYRVRRYWVSGSKKGEDEIFIDNLPGFPDGISAGRDNTFWIAIANPRNTIVDALMPHPWLRKVIVRLPQWLQPAAKPYALILQVDSNGKILRSLHDPEGVAYSFVTSVQEHGDRLYFGSIHESAIGVLTYK